VNSRDANENRRRDARFLDGGSREIEHQGAASLSGVFIFTDPGNRS
jgi:hypothetical protein